MSTQNENKNSSPSILHYVNNSNKTELPLIHHNDSEGSSIDMTKMESSFVQDNNTEQLTENVNNEKSIKTVSHSRRVHFPTDDSQLCIISHAPEPLSNRPLLSLGVILQRYRAACLRLQIRPLNCLLDQLGTMDDGRKSFYDRLDCLKIVNEKLDLRHIDAIEEIFSRCRFHTLDFDSTIFDDQAYTQLFDVIEYYESCTHINLSNNRSINFSTYQSLTKYLRKTNSLERLDMNLMRFDDNSILSFTRSLRSSTTLYELHVESCQLNGKLLQKFIENLRSCVSLRELYLCDNRLQVQDSLLINNLIRTCGQSLYLLDLRSNSLQDNGMSHLASQFSQYDEHHKTESNLHKISFQANQLTQQGVGFLAKALLHNRTIHSLNLSNNNITNEGLFLLRDALLTNRTINELILRNCRLTDQAAIALAEFIAESTVIQYIDLRENTIQASGICGMAIAIKNNKTLLKLDFDPIVSTPTYLSTLSNNIDRTKHSTNPLSLTNLRKMTIGLTSLTSSTSFQSTTNSSGGGTRELLEQKARWMNDIAAVCQRNVLIYEEKLRQQQQQQQQQENNQTVNGINETNTVIKPEDIELKDQTLDKNQSEDNEHSTLPIPDNNKEISEPVNPSSSDTDGIEQSIFNSVDNNDEVKQSEDTIINSDTNIEQSIKESVDFGLNDNDNNPDQNSTSLSDPTDDTNDDDKRKIRHSDSFYLLKKKVQNRKDDTSDDESQLSSIEEQIVDGV